MTIQSPCWLYVRHEPIGARQQAAIDLDDPDLRAVALVAVQSKEDDNAHSRGAKEQWDGRILTVKLAALVLRTAKAIAQLDGVGLNRIGSDRLGGENHQSSGSNSRYQLPHFNPPGPRTQR